MVENVIEKDCRNGGFKNGRKKCYKNIEKMVETVD
jgi:hypothetical protein